MLELIDYSGHHGAIYQEVLRGEDVHTSSCSPQIHQVLLVFKALDRPPVHPVLDRSLVHLVLDRPPVFKVLDCHPVHLVLAVLKVIDRLKFS